LKLKVYSIIHQNFKTSKISKFFFSLGSRDDFCADLKTHLQEMPRQGPAFDHFMKTNNVKLNQKKGLGFIYGFADDPPEYFFFF